YALHQNYPNPFNPTTVIRYEIPDDQAVTIRVYDLSGRELETLVNGAQTAGSHEVVWNAAGYASGIYLYRIEAGSFSKLLRMLLIK
ncbi:T9SS type A sorting domain-containing protein, partial [bacterium]|nr:T9SS type A sorting domain-containing protein [bacterium]